MSKIQKRFALLLAFVLSLFVAIPAFAEGTNVTNMQELKDAITNGDSIITVANDIVVNETIEIPASYNGTIQAGGKVLILDSGVENMFHVPNGANVTFNSITFDGQGNGRIIDAGEANVTIKNSTLKNATTEPFEQKIVEGKDTQRFDGGAIYADHTMLNLENTNFENNHTKSGVPSPGAPNGGAIVSYSANITIKSGQFINNYTGRVSADSGQNGEGGAIKLHPGSTLTINDENVEDKATTKFSGNHLDGSGDAGGRQGGAIEATQSTVSIYGTTFEIKGPFNTGGAIKFENCEGNHKAVVKNCDFIILPNQGIWTFGVAGGAITSEGSNLSIDSSNFQTGQGTSVAEAGGLIQVAGSGTFELMNSTLTGSGSGWNQTQQLKTAKYGGAINFYNGSTVKAKIQNTTIQNFTSEISGAGIGISTEAASQLAETTPENMANRTCPAAITLELNNTKLLNNATYSFDNGSYGGGMFIGSGSTVTMTGGQISSSQSSSTGAGIYNEGNLTIQGGAQVINNNAYYMAGGILNDGYLKIDDATVSGTAKKDWANANQHIFNKDEMAGQNIYAAKDVIITPKAVFGNSGDIRVLHGKSAVLLTGHYPKQLNISISESQTPKNASNNNPASVAVQESQYRHIGYVVAKGTEGYSPTAEDAKMLHYVSKDTSQPIAEASDHTSIGKWDFVFDPEAKTVVLGQRAKMTYHANYDDKSAKFNDGTKEKDQFYTFYGSGGGEPKVSVNDIAVAYLTELEEKPVSKWIFDGWYNHNPNQPIKDDDSTPFRNTKENDVSKSKVNFKDAYFVKTEDKITKIVDPNELHVYAGWSPLTIKLVKEWDDDGVTNPAKNATLTITPTGNGATETFMADRINLTKTFKNLDKYEKDGKTPIEYKVDEPTVPVGYSKKILFEESKDGTSLKYTVTNTKKVLYKVVHEFKAADGLTVALPEAIKNRTPKDQNDIADGTKVSPSDFDNKEYDDKTNNGKWTFVKWDKTEDTINGADVKFVGTWNFTKNETPDPKPTLYKVVHEFKAADGLTVALPDAIKSWTPADQPDKADGTKVSPSEFKNKEYDDKANGGKWTFKSWDKTEDTIKGADVKFIGTWNFKKNETPNPPEPEKQEIIVKLSKEDNEGNKVVGATITLSRDGKIIGEWVSDEAVKEFKLSEGTYTFKEIKTPQGYKTASKIEFKVLKDENTEELKLKVVEFGERNKQSKSGTLIMVDMPEEKPGKPDEPSKPNEPTNPDKPGTPDKPSTPDQPSTPEEPSTPEKPTTPDKPAVPDKPDNQDKPSMPDKPAKPDKPSNPDQPRTGESFSLIIYTLVLIAGASLLLSMVFKKRKSNR